MLLPDNIKPEYSVFYVGALILKSLHRSGPASLLDLFQRINERDEVSFSLYSLSLDWLYLIDGAEIKESGEIMLCL